MIFTDVQHCNMLISDFSVSPVVLHNLFFHIEEPSDCLGRYHFQSHDGFPYYLATNQEFLSKHI